MLTQISIRKFNFHKEQLTLNSHHIQMWFFLAFIQSNLALKSYNLHLVNIIRNKCEMRNAKYEIELVNEMTFCMH